MSNFTDDSSEASEEDIHDLHDPIMREMERPRDGYQPIPLTLIFLFFGLIGWGGWYMGAYSGDWRVDVFYPDQETAADDGDEEDSGEMSEDELRTDGERVYNTCASCHQSDGKGTPGSFPPLDGSEWVTGDAELPIRIVLHGLEGPIEVAGEEYDNNMPQQGEQLSDQEIAAVLTYVRTSWSNDAGAVEPSQVEQVREETADRDAPWTASDLGDLVP